MSRVDAFVTVQLALGSAVCRLVRLNCHRFHNTLASLKNLIRVIQVYALLKYKGVH